MKVEFYQDSDIDIGQPHLLKHGVTEVEVLEALENPHEDMPGQEGTRVATGRSRGGRYLRVNYVTGAEPDGGVFVLTAYKLKGKSGLKGVPSS